MNFEDKLKERFEKEFWKKLPNGKPYLSDTHSNALWFFISQSFSDYKKELVEEIKGKMYLYEHHFKENEALCGTCREVVTNNTPCKASRYYESWFDLNEILSLLQKDKEKERVALCEVCGEPMPEGEEMFKYHGYSGDCPKPPKKISDPTDKLFVHPNIARDLKELKDLQTKGLQKTRLYSFDEVKGLISKSRKEERKAVVEEIKSWATQELKSGSDYDNLYELLDSLTQKKDKI